SRRRGRRCASRPREIRPARSSTLRCLEMAGWLMAKGLASSATDASPEASRAKIARRVESARAAKVASGWAGVNITSKLYNLEVIYSGTIHCVKRFLGEKVRIVAIPRDEKSRKDFAAQALTPACANVLL